MIELGISTEKLLDEAGRIAREAGNRILEIYETDFTVGNKADDTPLTEADLAAHRCILERLNEIGLQLPVFSEESDDLSWSRRCARDTLWLVDPLDGTREFVGRNGEFTVNIALIREHQPVLGVVHVPVTGITYSAARGLGAFKATGDGPRQAISVRKPAASPVRVVSSRSHAAPQLEDYLQRLGEHRLVPIGSSLKFCLVAEGEADLYPRMGPTSEWDTAAGQAVVECAGGHVLTRAGEALQYNTGESMLNPHFLVFGDSGRSWPRLP